MRISLITNFFSLQALKKLEQSLLSQGQVLIKLFSKVYRLKTLTKNKSLAVFVFMYVFSLHLPDAIAQAITQGDVGAASDYKVISIRDISSHEENDMSPVFSPDGTKLAYVRASIDKIELRILDLETQQDRPVQAPLMDFDSAQFIGKESKFGIQLSWAPNSRFFAFVGQGMNLYLGCVGMEKAFQLTTAPEVDAEPKWSPDGKYIAFVSGRTGSGDIYLLKIADVLRNFFDDESCSDLSKKAESKETLINLTPNSPGTDYGPNWSPESDAIAYHSYSQPKGEATFNIQIIRGIDKIANNIDTRIVNTEGSFTGWSPAHEMYPSWSPNGRFIAFYSNADVKNGTSGGSRFFLHVMSDKTDWRECGSSYGYAQNNLMIWQNECIQVNIDGKSGPAWSPDGSGILYAERNTEKKDPIYRVEVRESDNRERKCKELDFSVQPLKLDTRMNSDVTICEDNAKIAFISKEGARSCLNIAIDLSRLKAREGD